MGRDRDVLFAVTALSRGLVAAEEILALGPVIGTRPDESLADLLVERGRLSCTDRDQLDSEVAARLLADVTTEPATRLVEASSSTDDPAPAIGFPGASIALDSTDDPTELWTGSLQTTSPDAGCRDADGSRVVEGLADPPSPRDRYRDGRRLQGGGMGEVWLFSDAHLGRDVVLKVVRGDRRSASLVERFHREAKLSSRLEHPNIVTVHEVAGTDGQGDGTPFYTMRHVRGGTLSRAILAYHAGLKDGSAGRVELVGLLEGFVTVCRAVAYAHSFGVLHRDLKPANIAIGDFGEVIVLDWGIAKIRAAAKAGSDDPGGLDPLDPVGDPSSFDDLLVGSGSTVDGAVLGTHAYMPPEQARGEHHLVAPCSDVYSLGAILYEILTAHKPFSGPTRADYLRQIEREQPTPPRQHDPRVSPALAAICLKAMAKEPSSRYASALELADDVRRWLADEPVSVYPEPWPTRVRRKARRHRAGVAAVGALIATAVAALAIGDVLVRIERDHAETERANAVLARGEAEVARARAEASRDVASQVVNRLLVTVADVELDGLPGVTTVRQRVADQAVEIYRRGLSRPLGDDSLSFDAAQVFRHAGNLRRMTDDLDAARPLFGQASDLLENLVEANPEQALYRDRQAETLRDFASLEERINGPLAAEPLLRRSLEVVGGLRRDFPDVPEFARTEAISKLDLGSVELEDGRLDDAGDHLGAAAETLAALADRHDRATRLTDPILAVLALDQLTEVYRRGGRVKEASEAIEEAIRRGRQNLETLASVPDSRATLANALLERANLRAGQGLDASEDFEAALAILRDLSREAPSITFYTRRLAIALTRRGWSLDPHTDGEAARTDAREAVASLERLEGGAPRATLYLIPLGDALGLLGHLDLAAGDLEAAHAHLAEARRRIDQARKAAPGSLDARDALQRVESDLARLGGPARP